MGEPVLHFLNKCIDCSHDFYLTEENPYYVCEKCDRGRKIYTFKESYDSKTSAHRNCVHCGVLTGDYVGKTESKKQWIFSGNYFECADCHRHMANNRALNQAMNCTKLGFMAEGKYHYHMKTANLILYFGKLTLSLTLTQEQLTKLIKDFEGQIDWNKYPGKPHRGYKGYESPHHDASLDFSKNPLETKLECYFTWNNFGNDYGVGSGTLSFMVREGAFTMNMTGPQLHHFYSVAKSLQEMTKTMTYTNKSLL